MPSKKVNLKQTFKNSQTLPDFKSETRDSFQSKLGFILACIGSAVGMGNIWMFPYRVGQQGGAAFLIPYLLFVIIIGFSGVIGEMAFGRAMKAGPIGAFKKATQKYLHNNWGYFLGFIPVFGSLVSAILYSVVVGWIIRFIAFFLAPTITKIDPSEYFNSIAGNFSNVPSHLIGLLLTLSIMVFGISKGIENLNKILMPAFFVLFIILAIRVAFLPNSTNGYIYLFNINWVEFYNPKTWIFALGQAFFSLSIAGSGTLIYGSYLKDNVNIISCAKNVVIFDTVAALLAAVTIIPAIFSFGYDLQSGPALMFIAMPNIFKQMPLGQIFALIFFLAILFAALTSLVNLFETPIEALQFTFHFSRAKSVTIVFAISVIVSLFIENAAILSKWMDILSIYIIPLGALLAGIMFFWLCGSKFARQQVEKGLKKPLGKWFKPLTKYVFIGLTLIIYILGIVLSGIG